MSNIKKSFFGYSQAEQEDKIAGIAKFLKPKEMCKLRENVSYIEKISVLSLSTKKELLRKFDLVELGIIFKLSTSKLIKSFLQDLSTSMKQEILFSIQQEYKIGQVMDAQQRLVTWLSSEEKKGSVVLCEVANSTLV